MLARVRMTRLALPLATLLFLAIAAPASAFDWKVDVTNFAFTPPEHKIAVGDTVTWNFVDAGHTSASLRGQPDSWRSAQGTATNPVGVPFTHQFNVPGKYQYICLQHSFMEGTIEVGTDTVIDSIDNFKTKRIGHRVKLSFKLNEAARVTYNLTGPSRRTVKEGRLAAGKHSFTLKRLKKGTYRGKLTVVDDFDKKITPRNFFVIR
jgi:plastocyanin